MTRILQGKLSIQEAKDCSHLQRTTGCHESVLSLCTSYAPAIYGNCTVYMVYKCITSHIKSSSNLFCLHSTAGQLWESDAGNGFLGQAGHNHVHG